MTEKQRLKRTPIPRWKHVVLFLLLFFWFILNIQYNRPENPTFLIVSIIIVFTIVFFLLFREFRDNVEASVLGVHEDSPFSFNKIFFQFAFFSLFAILCSGLIVFLVLGVTFDILSIHLGTFSALMTILFLFVGLLYGFLIAFPFYLFHCVRQSLGKKAPFNIWIAITIGAIVVVLMAGSFFLTQVFSKPDPIKFDLTNNGSKLGFTCGQNEEIIAGRKIDCAISNNNTPFKEMVAVYTAESSESRAWYNDKLQLYPPKDTTHIKIELLLTNTSSDLEYVGDSNIHVPSYDDRQQNIRYFIGFMLGLFAVVLITIPQGVKTLRDLWHWEK